MIRYPTPLGTAECRQTLPKECRQTLPHGTSPARRRFSRAGRTPPSADPTGDHLGNNASPLTAPESASPPSRCLWAAGPEQSLRPAARPVKALHPGPPSSPAVPRAPSPAVPSWDRSASPPSCAPQGAPIINTITHHFTYRPSTTLPRWIRLELKRKMRSKHSSRVRMPNGSLHVLSDFPMDQRMIRESDCSLILISGSQFSLTLIQ